VNIGGGFSDLRGYECIIYHHRAGTSKRRNNGVLYSMQKQTQKRLQSGAKFISCSTISELELELIQTQMAQKPMLRAEVYAHAMRASQFPPIRRGWMYCVLHSLLPVHFRNTILTRAQRTRVHSCPQHWLLCILSLY